MDLKALRTFRFGNTNIRRGGKVEMTDARAKEHITRGLVEEIKAPAPKPKPKADDKPKD
jgi:hypothetical protein